MNFLNSTNINSNQNEPLSSLFPFLIGPHAHTTEMSSLYDQFAVLYRQTYANNAQAQAYGDPHYIGFNNQNFDCMPKIDAILFKHVPEQFEIQARHAMVNSVEGSPTVIKAIAVKVKSQIIEYNAADCSFLVNGQKPHFGPDGLFLQLEQTQTSIVLENTSKFDIYTNFGARLTIYNCGGYNLNVTLTLPRAVAQNAECSLFGKLTGEHGQIIPATGLFSTEQPSTYESYVGHDKERGYGAIRNDEKSKSTIVESLQKKGFSRENHEPTFDNLVFDYLNTPDDLRDQLIEQNIDPVQDQLKMRREQIQLQEKEGYFGGSFDLVERGESGGYLERLEKRVSALEMMAQNKPVPTIAGAGRLESLEKRISELEKRNYRKE